MMYTDEFGSISEVFIHVGYTYDISEAKTSIQSTQ